MAPCFKRCARWLCVAAVMSGSAEAAGHWDFIPPQKAPLGPAASAHPIDALLNAGQSASGLKPQPGAERMILIRRIYLDLIGLPPNREQLLSDEPIEHIADRLLASPSRSPSPAPDTARLIRRRR